MIRRKLYIFYIVLALAIMVECRKFDIEDESKKLFGEDLQSVLQKFRRTPEYLKILKEKMQNLHGQVAEIALHTLYYYEDALKNRVNEIVGLNSTEIRSRDDFSIRFQRSKEDVAEDETVNTQLREAENDDEDGIRQLDKFYQKQTDISAQEKNSFVDLGFEYAGRIIHYIIKNLGAEDGAKAKSTKFSEDEKSTTEHAKIHEVTTTSPPEASTAALQKRGGAKIINNLGRFTVIND